MRDIKRRIARHLMEMHGVEKINRKQYIPRVNKSGGGKPPVTIRKQSFFALHWREYLDPASDYRKDLENKLKRAANWRSLATGKHVEPAWPVQRKRPARP